LSFHPDGQLLAASGAGGEVGLYNLDDGREVARLDAGGTAALTPDGRQFVAGGKTSVIFRRVDDRTEARRFDSPGGRATLGRLGRLLAISGREAVSVRLAGTGAEVATLPQGPAARAATGPTTSGMRARTWPSARTTAS
jgi:hypothetical protein